MEYSVIVLLEETNEDFCQFVQSLHDVFMTRGNEFEIVIVANGTGGFLRDKFRKMPVDYVNVKAFELSKKNPQAVGLKVGFEESCGEVIVVCGPYQQLAKESFSRLLDSLDEGTDIISPWRKGRVDPSINQFQSRLFNGIVRKITGTSLHDLSCTVKLFRREVLEETKLYGGLYRFLPIIAGQKGFKTKEVKCEHFQERGETGFYSVAEYAERIIDIFTLYFVTQFTKKPLRFFSFLGFSISIIGLAAIGYILFEKIFLAHPIGNRPVLLIAVFFLALGVQVGSMGLLGEIIAFTHGRQKPGYTIEKII